MGIGARRCKVTNNSMKSSIWALLAGVTVLVVHRTTGAAEDPVQQAGALLAAGRLAEAEAAARACPDPRCALVLGRALFGLGRLSPAADALEKADAGLGELKSHAEVLRGEALLLDRRPRDAVGPLRSAEKAPGPAGLRAAALLADALLAAGDFAVARKQAELALSLSWQPVDVRAGLAWVSAQARAGEARANPALARAAAEAARGFWLSHPEHPAAESARALERELRDLGVALADPTGRELLSHRAGGSGREAAQGRR